jgi:hypothetical protein
MRRQWDEKALSREILLNVIPARSVVPAHEGGDDIR